MAAEGLPVQVACRTLAVSEADYYAHLIAAPSEHSIRHAWSTDVIRQGKSPSKWWK
jgi:putative transposase